MAYAKHTWRANEEPSLESMNNIQRGIADAEANAVAQFAYINAQIPLQTGALVPRDGSKGMTGDLTVSASGKGVAFDNGGSIYSDGTNIAASGTILTASGSPMIDGRTHVVGQSAETTLYAGANTIYLSRFAGRDANGAAITTGRNGGIPIDPAGGYGYYLVYCTVYIRTISAAGNPQCILSISNYPGASANAITEAYQAAFGSNSKGMCLFANWISPFNTGTYLIPSIQYSPNGSQNSATATLLAIRMA